MTLHSEFPRGLRLHCTLALINNEITEGDLAHSIRQDYARLLQAIPDDYVQVCLCGGQPGASLS